MQKRRKVKNISYYLKVEKAEVKIECLNLEKNMFQPYFIKK